MQDHVDANLLFLGTELGLYVTTDGGDAWFKYDQGVPTVSVMDMAIQQRENDLILGTHGRSVIIIDDYSPLRGLNEKSFEAEFTLLGVTDGQQYVSNRVPSSRFWGDAAYVGDNEAYGVTINVMVSGQHLVHPDFDLEKARLLAKAEQAKKDKNNKKDENMVIKALADKALFNVIDNKEEHPATKLLDAADKLVKKWMRWKKIYVLLPKPKVLWTEAIKSIVTFSWHLDMWAALMVNHHLLLKFICERQR
ncbi:MAG: hypothetical protein ACJAVV_001683 [Alphaproteobacteria bacterium]